jgi:three-Cys-motif partner protein
MAQDRWPELCELYKSDDGMPVREVGSWTEDKLYFWNRYIDITTRAMVGHPSWPAGLAYVDLFAGPGICKLRDSDRRFPGSPLIAANAPKQFRAILSIELDPQLAAALATRLEKTPAAGVAKVFHGNCNTGIDQLIRCIPDRALTLGFIDPESLNVEFETVKKLSDCGQVDLLILFADRMDLVRNVDRYEREQPSVLDRMMGPHSHWRELWTQLTNRAPDNICRLFVNEYKSQLQSQLGYLAFGEKIMRSANGPIYRLIYASKSEKGLEFWNKVTQKNREGQMDFPFQG